MRATDLYLNENEIVNEINMSPGGLQRLASTIDARAGMEFEMIVPGLGDVDSDGDQEPDMDQDERARSIGDIREFFHDGDYNGRRDVERLEQNLLDSYYDSDFLSERKREAWEEASYESIKELVERDYEDDLREQAKEEVLAQVDEFGTNADELRAAVEERFDELFDAKVNEILADMGREYDEAYEDWEGNEWPHIMMDWESDWLEHEGIETMWDVAQNYDISWPHWTQENDGEVNVQLIADDFSDALGKPINASTSYHGARRSPGHYVVEPDGSLDPDDGDDTGLEFVSPPMPLEEMLSDFLKVKKWAAKHGCYTNKSTGLHINVSVPNFSLQSLDYVKLALLLGDKYILDQYGRSSNTYCKSALDKVKTLIKQNPDNAKQLLDQMRGHLKDLATKAIHSGSTDKYTSINTKTGYIEFRSPGGDWLNANFDKIKDTLLRFTVALDAALDPNKYREEYLKKLYKLLEPTAVETKSVDTVKFFSDYVAGKMPKAALRSFIKQAQLERKFKRGEVDPNTKFWWRVYKEGKNAPNGAEMEVVAQTKQEAQDLAAAEWGYATNPRRHTWDAEPIRPYDKTPVRATSGEPQPIGQQTGRHTYRIFTTDGNETVGTFQSDGIQGSTTANITFRNFLFSIGRDSAAGFNYEEIGRERQANLTLGGRPSNPDGNWVIIGNRRPVYRFMAANRDDAETVWLQWSREHQGQHWELEQASQPGFQEPNQGGNLTPQGSPPWELYRLSSNTPYRTISAQDPAAAEQEARSALGFRGEDPADFGIRSRPQETNPLTGAGREHIGWKIIDGAGNELYSFSGAGNSQSDANRIAMQWINQQREQGRAFNNIRELEVVPNWREV